MKNRIKLRDSLPYFVAGLRTVDAFRKKQSTRAFSLYEAQEEANIGFLKDPLAKSTDPKELIDFLENTSLDTSFMMQLPSVRRKLTEWWDEFSIDGEITFLLLRDLYSDMAWILMREKPHPVLKNCVGTLLRAEWASWNEKTLPLTQLEFEKMVFMYAHLMTENARIGDYLTILKQMLHSIRVFRQKKASSCKRSTAVTKLPSTILHQSESPSKEVGGAVRGGSEKEMAELVEAELQEVRADNNSGNESSAKVYHTVPTASTPGAGTGKIINSIPLVDAGGGIPPIHISSREIMPRSKSRNSQHIIEDPLLRHVAFQKSWRTNNDVGSSEVLGSHTIPPVQIIPLRSVLKADQCGELQTRTIPSNGLDRTVRFEQEQSVEFKKTSSIPFLTKELQSMEIRNCQTRERNQLEDFHHRAALPCFRNCDTLISMQELKFEHRSKHNPLTSTCAELMNGNFRLRPSTVPTSVPEDGLNSTRRIKVGISQLYIPSECQNSDQVNILRRNLSRPSVLRRIKKQSR